MKTEARLSAELVRRAMEQNQASWAELYEATCREAYFVALKVSGSEDDAMDLVQDAYVTAYERLPQLAEPEKFRSWLNMIVANKCRDYLKKKKPALFTDLEREDGPEPDWEDDREYGNPDDELDHRETVRLVAEMIDGLPVDQKLCILLYYRDELSVGQIARSLEVSEGTVKSRLNYARQKIKASVEKLEKQGVKLYGLAPLTFLAWQLKSEAEAASLPAALAAVPAVGTAGGTAAAAGSAVSSGAASAAVTAPAAVGTKTLLNGIGAKVIAGILAGSVAVGGVAVYQNVADRRELDQTIQAAETAYQELLTRGVTDDGLPIRYYTYLDLNQDEVPELLVADNPAVGFVTSRGELYCYQNDLQLVGTPHNRKDSFYLVNEKYVRSGWRLGPEFFGIDDYIGAFNKGDKSYLKDQDGACTDISLDEFQYYYLMPDEAAALGVDSFVKTAEVISFQENTFAPLLIRIPAKQRAELNRFLTVFSRQLVSDYTGTENDAWHINLAFIDCVMDGQVPIPAAALRDMIRIWFDREVELTSTDLAYLKNDQYQYWPQYDPNDFSHMVLLPDEYYAAIVTDLVVRENNTYVAAFSLISYDTAYYFQNELPLLPVKDFFERVPTMTLGMVEETPAFYKVGSGTAVLGKTDNGMYCLKNYQASWKPIWEIVQ